MTTGPPPSASSPLPDLDPAAYDRWRATGVGAIAERLERSLMLELIGNLAGKRVLDVGCGDGDFTMELCRRGAVVTGVDRSPEMIAAAKARLARTGGTATFETAEADRLPGAANEYDLVVAMTILCFVADAGPVFREIARVLRPGGRLVIGELGRFSTWAADRRIRAWLGSELWRRGRFRSPGELRQLAQDAGLVPGPVRGAVYFPRSDLAARLMAPIDGRISRLTNAGAAFLAVAAVKGQPLTLG